MTQDNDFKVDRRTVLKIGAGSVAMAVAGIDLTGDARAADAASALESGADAARGGLGARVSRADGVVKVAGQARYAIEQQLDNLVYGVIVQSTLPAGRVTAIDVTAAKAVPGVLDVYTPQHPLKINPTKLYSDGGAATELFLPLQDDLIRFNGQHIAIVIAESFEQATEAAHLLKAQYAPGEPIFDLNDPKAKSQPIADLTTEWGNAADAFASADVKVEVTYTTAREYNVPMEPHACIANWEGDKLTVWEPSQWVGGARSVIAEWMAIDIENVRVISPYVGGGFGSKIAPHPHVALACAAARELRRPVKVSLTRPQTFTGLGGRPATRQTLALGATRDGKLVSIVQEGWNETAIDDVHVEPCNAATKLMYATPNLSAKHSVVAVHTVKPSWKRAPGDNPSVYALESAMDELAYALNMDPIELRLANWAARDPSNQMPWSTRQLREAYAAGAEAFGWSKRNPLPRSMREGRELIGWGMASGVYPRLSTASEAKVIIYATGKVEVLSAGTDIGTGTYTILAQTAAEVLGIPVVDVTVKLGDTNLPRSAVAGGSQQANNLAGAVDKAARAAREALLAIAASDTNSPMQTTRPNDLIYQNGKIRPSRRRSGGVSIAELLTTVRRDKIEVEGNTFSANATESDKTEADRTFSQMKSASDGGISAHSWSAQFVEVRVDEDFGTIRVKRMVAAFDCGRIFNPKLAESQWIGGMVMGLGQTLLEEGLVDPRDGRIVNANFADYAVPVNADVPDIITLSVGVPDLQASPLGGKGVGEIGVVGVAAAIGNAVFHATGKRIRSLPITLDKLV